MIYSDEIAKKAYRMIDKKASSNSVIQGISGAAGFPFTLITDGAVILTHYSTLLNEIRALYDRKPLNEDVVSAILKGASGELLFDLVFDKVLGNIPLIGMYFNAVCAKTMTWRLGILFTMMSSLGEEMNESDVKNTMILIRQVFPQSDTFKFKQPNYNTFVKLINSINEDHVDVYRSKVLLALEAFE